MDAGVVLRFESLKSEHDRDGLEIAAHQAKIERTFDLIEREERWLSQPFDVGSLALVCAIEWLVFRDLVPDPVADRPRLKEWLAGTRDRPSLAVTRP